jgi:hypothetical protein
MKRRSLSAFHSKGCDNPPEGVGASLAKRKDRSGEGESARYTDEREKLHGRIMQELLAPDKLRAALPPSGEKPVFMILGGTGEAGKVGLKGKYMIPQSMSSLTPIKSRKNYRSLRDGTPPMCMRNQATFLNKCCPCAYGTV